MTNPRARFKTMTDYTKAVWVLSTEYTNLDLAMLKRIGYTYLFIQVDSTNYTTILPHVLGLEGISDFKVFAWINCFYDGTEWLKPTDTDRQTTVINFAKTLATTYAIQGIHLDYCRWSGACDEEASLYDLGVETVTDFVTSLRTQVKNAKTGTLISVAVVPNQVGIDPLLVFGQDYTGIGNVVDVLVADTFVGIYQNKDSSWIQGVIEDIRVQAPECTLLAGLQCYDSNGALAYSVVCDEAQKAVDGEADGWAVYTYGQVGEYPVIEEKTATATTTDVSHDIETGNKLLLQNLDGNWDLYTFTDVTVKADQGEQSLNADGEHIYYELQDYPPITEDLTGKTAEEQLDLILANTNWSRGVISLNETQIDLTLKNQNPLAALTALAKAYSAELQFYVTVDKTSITGRYVDLLQTRGNSTGMRFEFGRNMTGVSVEVDNTDVKTALYATGKSTTDSTTKVTTTIDFKDVVWKKGEQALLWPSGPSMEAPMDKPAGQTWLGDEDARVLYGKYDTKTKALTHRFGTFSSEDASAEELLWSTYDKLNTLKVPTVNIKTTVAMLGQISGYETELLSIGDTVDVLLEGMRDPLQARVISIDEQRHDPSSSAIELGDFKVRNSVLDIAGVSINIPETVITETRPTRSESDIEESTQGTTEINNGSNTIPASITLAQYKDMLARVNAYHIAHSKTTTSTTGNVICGDFKPSACHDGSQPYVWGHYCWLNYCPNCGRYGTLLNNPKHQYEGELTCSHCDSDYCGHCGREKKCGSSSKLTPASTTTTTIDAWPAAVYITTGGTAAIAFSIWQQCVSYYNDYVAKNGSEPATIPLQIASIVASSSTLAVPYMKQPNSYTCGPTSLYMILSFYGCGVSEATLAGWSGTGRNGTSHAGLAAAAGRAGARCNVAFSYNEARYTGPNQIKANINAGKPMIGHIQCRPGSPPYVQSYTGGHYIVIRGYNDSQYFVNDPAWGTKWLAYDDLAAALNRTSAKQILTFK